MDTVKADIETINILSQQLLSEIEIERVAAENTLSAEQPLTDTETALEHQVPNPQKLTPLISKRHTLIVNLFNAYTQVQLQDEIDLINEMLLLDKQLKSALQSSKNELAEQVINMKKRSKINKLYKKY